MLKRNMYISTGKIKVVNKNKAARESSLIVITKRKMKLMEKMEKVAVQVHRARSFILN
jgi:hypothetical protein